MKYTSDYILRGPPMTKECPLDGIGCMIFEACDTHAEQVCHVSPRIDNPVEDFTETFQSFKERSSSVAQELVRQGLRAGDMLVNCTPNHSDSGLTTAACFYIGAIPSTLDPTLSERDCANLLQQIKPKFIFVHEASVLMIENAIGLTNLEDDDMCPQIVVHGKSEQYPTFQKYLERPAINFHPVAAANLDATVMVLFSSGSTGLPKGILLSHRTLFSGSVNFQLLFDNVSRMLHYTTLYWISGVLAFVTQFISGGCRIAARTFDQDEFCNIVSKHNVTAAFLANCYAYQMHTIGWHLQVYDMSTLKTIVFSGGPVSDVQLNRVRSWFPQAEIFTGYGMTEASSFLTGFQAEARKVYAKFPGSVGLPLCGTQIKFVDPATGQVLGPEQPGELFFKLGGRFNGYHNYINEGLYDAEGYFKTGDVGYFNEEGLIFITDRLRDMFKYMSWHIVPVALEMIINEHPAVQESVVFGVPDEAAENLPAAVVVLRKGCRVTPEEIKAFVAEHAIDRQHLRGGVYIVDALIKTPSGKPQRYKIKQSILSTMA